MNRLAGFLAVGALMGAVSTTHGATIFSDDFESGLGQWTQGSSPHTIDTTRNVVPVGGSQSAYASSSADFMSANLASEVGGPSTFSFYAYDPVIGGAESTRLFGTVRSYAPDNTTLQQLLAIGKYNSVTTGTYDATLYQARVAFGSVGWINLDGPGAPTRSVGWHQFTIERLADNSTLNFYVDGILSKTLTGQPVADTWDRLGFGLGLGSTLTDGNYDGVLVTDTLVPEPSSLALLGLAGAAMIRRRRNA